MLQEKRKPGDPVKDDKEHGRAQIVDPTDVLNDTEDLLERAKKEAKKRRERDSCACW
jgi:hypothetical protein